MYLRKYYQKIIKKELYCNIILGWSLFEEKKICDPPKGHKHTYKDRHHSVEKCASLCSGVASMFVFGTNDFNNDRCNIDGCSCYCLPSATEQGTCQTKEHTGFRLYKFTTPGYYLTFLCLIINFIFNLTRNH